MKTNYNTKTANGYTATIVCDGKRAGVVRWENEQNNSFADVYIDGKKTYTLRSPAKAMDIAEQMESRKFDDMQTLADSLFSAGKIDLKTLRAVGRFLAIMPAKAASLLIGQYEIAEENGVEYYKEI